MSTTYAIKKAVADTGEFFEKNAQVTPIKKIGDGKCAPLQQLVNIFPENKEIPWCETVLDTRVKTVDQRVN